MGAGAIIGLGALSAAGGIMGGVSAQNQAEKQAGMFRAQGIIAAGDARRDSADLQGAQRAASTTADPNSGSALDIQLEAAVEGELNAMRAKFGMDQRARAAEDAGQAALTSSIVGGVTSILGASISAASLSPTAPTTTGGGGTPSGMSGGGIWDRPPARGYA